MAKVWKNPKYSINVEAKSFSELKEKTSELIAIPSYAFKLTKMDSEEEFDDGLVCEEYMIKLKELRGGCQ